MSKTVSIIGNDKTIVEKSKQIIESNKYQLKYIMYDNINYNLLNETNCIYIDENLIPNIKEAVLNFCIKNNKEIFVFPSVIQIMEKLNFHNINDSLVFKISSFRLKKYQRIIKRAFDIGVSLLVVVIFSPLMVLIYLMIKLFDPGPAIYLQKRLTIDQKEFILYKYRTMVNNAEKKSGAVLSSVDDNRITKIGRFLRKTRLDELPQIFNVLKGDMSIVGPRPERGMFVQDFCNQDIFYQYRFRVKAGITGLSQINCKYSTKYYDKLKYDLLYIARYRFIADIKIILKTIIIMFDKRASEGMQNVTTQELLNKYNLDVREIEPGILELRNNDEKNSV